jgi:hypothetical protein
MNRAIAVGRKSFPLWCAAVLLLFFMPLAPLSAQQGPQTKAVSAPPAASAQADEAAAARRQMALIRAQGFAQKILGFRNIETKVMATARLADLLWKDDEVYARQLFTKALALTERDGTSTDAEIKLLAELRRQVIAILSRRDPKLARRLMDADKESDAAQRMEANFSIAYDSVKKEPEKAVKFAEQSLADGVFPYMVSLLMELRQRDRKAADALFLKSLERLVAQPFVDGNELLYLGTYVFTSPKIDATDKRTPPNAVAQIGLGNFVLYDITADRPDAPRELVIAYLKAATQILTQNVSDPTQQQLYYAASYLLLPKLQKFAPELIAPLSASMSALAPGIPQELTQPSSYSNFSNSAPKDLATKMKEIESSPDESFRNGRYLLLTFTLWQSRDYVNARLVADRISDLAASKQLKTLIAFGEAASLLEQNTAQILQVEAAAEKLPQDIERALLWLGIARAYADQGKAAQLREAVEQALAAANHVDDARKPFLTLEAAGQLSRVDPVLAGSLLTQVVRQFNGQKAESLKEVNWRRRVETGKSKLDFPLVVRGVDLLFSRALSRLVTADPEATLAAVNELTHEDLQAQAWIVITAVSLK